MRKVVLILGVVVASLGLSACGSGAKATIDTSIAGNSNAGHWFTDDRARPGRIGRALSVTERYALIEYLKAASYADYPRTVVQRPDPEPCVDDAEGYR